MKTNLLKLSIISLFTVLTIIYGLGRRSVHANSGGPPASRTGAPGELTCAIATCHNTSPLNSGGGTLSLTGLPANYTPGQDVTLTVTLNQAGRTRFGFQVTALDDQGRLAGTLTVTETGRTQLINGTIGGNLRRYIQHNPNGIIPNGTNQNTWTFRWTPPAATTGRVTFYVAGNAANGNLAETGDFIYTINQSVQPGSAVAAVAAVSAASFAANAPLAPDEIVALFGTNLAGGALSANSQPLPTELGGVRVRVGNADAPLFFVSGGQINFLVPPGLPNGATTITVTRDGNPVGQGNFTVEAVSPGLFAANADGRGVPAAVALRVRGGVQTVESVFQVEQGRATALPLNLGPEGDQLFLIAFGTGFRSAALATVSSTMGGENASVSFAGAVAGLAGLDQTNILIPRSLAGRGNVDVVFRADGKTANTVTINIR